MNPEEDDHRSRRMILNYLREHPGAGRQELSRVLQIRESTLRYHLLKMERAGTLSSLKDNGHPKFFCKYVEVSSEMLERGHLTRDQIRIFKFIKENPGSSQEDIAREVPRGNAMIGEDLRRLIRKHLISRSGKGKSAKFYPIRPDQIKTDILKTMISNLLSGEIDESTFLKLKDELDARFP